MKITIIANPKSGSYNANTLNRCKQILINKYGQVDVILTEHRLHASEIAKTVPSDFIIAAGGDGLINEVLNGIDNRSDSDKILFSPLPLGTRNVLCIEHNIPINPIEAASNLNIDNIKNIPLGFIGSRAFSLMCGFGYDADVVKSVTSKGYHSFKTAAHIKEGLYSLLKDYDELKVLINGEEHHCYHIIVSIAKNYAGKFCLFNNFCDNKLNIFMLKKKGALPILQASLCLVADLEFQRNIYTADSVEIEGTSITQIDGEFIDTGSNNNIIKIKNSAIKFVY